MSTTFRSIHHPEGEPRAAVYSKALVAPVGACVTPLMIGATAAALQGEAVWGFLTWGLPGALIVATLWTQFTLTRRPAVLHLRPGEAAVQSVHDVLYNQSPSWHALHGIHLSQSYTELSVGWRTYTFRPSQWPRYNQLREAAQRASSVSESSGEVPHAS